MKPRVLLLDDEPAVARALTRLLAAAGFDAVAATDADDALARLAAGSFAVVVSDERMPGIRGTEFLSRCAASFPGIPRILLTGYADAQIAADAVNRAEIFKLLFKPWTDDEFVTSVREAAWRHSLLDEEPTVPNFVPPSDEIPVPEDPDPA